MKKRAIAGAVIAAAGSYAVSAQALMQWPESAPAGTYGYRTVNPAAVTLLPSCSPMKDPVVSDPPPVTYPAATDVPHGRRR